MERPPSFFKTKRIPQQKRFEKKLEQSTEKLPLERAIGRFVAPRPSTHKTTNEDVTIYVSGPRRMTLIHYCSKRFPITLFFRYQWLHSNLYCYNIHVSNCLPSVTSLDTFSNVHFRYINISNVSNTLNGSFYLHTKLQRLLCYHYVIRVDLLSTSFLFP